MSISKPAIWCNERKFHGYSVNRNPEVVGSLTGIPEVAEDMMESTGHNRGGDGVIRLVILCERVVTWSRQME